MLRLVPLIALIVWSVSAFAEFRKYPIEDFLDTTAVIGGSFSPDGTKILVSTDQTGILNAYAIPVSGSEALQLTHSTTDSILAVSYFPNDERFLYTADQGGNELNHLYVMELDGTVKDLTPGENLKASFLQWADDEKSSLLFPNERAPKAFDVYESDRESYERRLFYENPGDYYVYAVSADRRFVALKRVYTTRDGDVYLHDRESGETKLLLGSPDAEVEYSPQFFDKDTLVLVCTTDLNHEFQYVAAVPLEGGALDTITLAEWDVNYASLSRNGGYWAEGLNVDGVAHARIRDIQTGDRIDLPEVDSAGASRVIFNNDDTAVAFYTQGARTPGDLYYWRLDGAIDPVRLTHRLSTRIDPSHRVEPEVVRFESYDGLEVP